MKSYREISREVLDHAMESAKLARIAYGRTWTLGTGTAALTLFVPDTARKRAVPALVKAGITTPLELCGLSREALLGIPGIGKNFQRDLEEKHGRLW